MYVLQENIISDFLLDINLCLIVKFSSNFWVKIKVNPPILLEDSFIFHK